MSRPVPLSLAALAGLPSEIARPRYERGSITPGIVHIGIGNFHRAHQALYLDDLMNRGEALDWGIIGAGVMPSDALMRNKLAAQDFLTTLVEQEAESSSVRVIGPMIGFVPPEDRAALLNWLADPLIRIVSLTITEGGYFLDSSGAPDLAHPALAADMASPCDPRTAFGLIIEGLRRRRAAGHAPFTVMCCDNIPHNGKVTRSVVVELAERIDAPLARWIEAHVAFPNTMVDRITPATTDAQRDWLAATHGLTDQWPVFCESFRQWVVEDHFPSGRPAFETAGVTFAPDVAPYELMKIRILNGGHAVIAYPAGLLDIVYVHEAMAHPLIAGFLDKIEREEIIPEVPPVPDTSLSDYLALIARRFSNPKIGDTIRRLCLDGSNRQPKFIVPAIADRLAKGRSVEGLALESALWCRYCAGVSDSGAVIEANDPSWAMLQERARAAASNPAIWTGMRAVYGDLGQDPAFAGPFAHWLATLGEKGTAAALSAYLLGKS
jgi:mannitol 2-dehydrogenase